MILLDYNNELCRIYDLSLHCNPFAFIMFLSKARFEFVRCLGKASLSLLDYNMEFCRIYDLGFRCNPLSFIMFLSTARLSLLGFLARQT